MTFGGFNPYLMLSPGSADPKGPTRHYLPPGGSHHSLPEPQGRWAWAGPTRRGPSIINNIIVIDSRL